MPRVWRSTKKNSGVALVVQRKKERPQVSASEKVRDFFPIQPDLQMNFSLNKLNHHEILMKFQQSSHEKHDTSLFGGLEHFFHFLWEFHHPN